MRLWHYKLIPFLPKKMLVSQWRELIAIKRQWEKESLIHPLVRYVKGYDKSYYANYTNLVYFEMLKRNIKCKKIYMQEILTFTKTKEIDNSLLFKEHDDEYLNICFYNLKEKYIRGIISEEEWKKLNNLYIEEK